MAVYLQTYSGIKFYPTAPSLDEIKIEDIAHALSNLCRYGGHTRKFYCPTQDQKILTSDLTWVEAGSLRLGDNLIGFDEFPIEKGSSNHLRRKFRPSKVTHSETIKRNILRLEMSDGSTVRASEEHPWLIATKQSRNQKWLTSREIKLDLEIGRKRYLHKFIEPWQRNYEFDDGWLSGIMDGEAYISFTNINGVQFGISQKPGLVLDQIEYLLKKNGFMYTPSKTGENTISLQIRGGWRELLRILGIFRPLRLLSKFETNFNSGNFNKQLDGVKEPLEIVKVYTEGEDWVQGIETSTHTYICEGYGAHNSVAEHSYWVAHYALELCPHLALDGLLHDSPEALGFVDIPRPIKSLLPEYKIYEKNLYSFIALKFGLEDPIPQAIKDIDTILLFSESNYVFNNGRAFDWGWEVKPFEDFRPEFWTPLYAEIKFMEMFDELTET